MIMLHDPNFRKTSLYHKFLLQDGGGGSQKTVYMFIELHSYQLFRLPTQLQIIAASKCHIIIYYFDLLLQAAGSSLLRMAMSPPLGLQRHN